MRHDHTSARHGEQWRDHWRTPAAFVRVVELHLGERFALDASATDRNRVCGRHLGPGSDIMTDALRRGIATGEDWHASADGGAIWLNPPYSQLGTAPWVDAAIVAVRRGSTVACLVPVRPCARWSQRLIMAASTILIPIGRLSFDLPHDMPGAAQAERASAPGDTWVVVLRGQPRVDCPSIRYVPRAIPLERDPILPGIDI